MWLLCIPEDATANERLKSATYGRLNLGAAFYGIASFVTFALLSGAVTFGPLAFIVSTILGQQTYVSLNV